MGKYPDGEYNPGDVVLVGNCPGGEPYPSTWGIVLRTGVVLGGNCPGPGCPSVGNILVGNCPYGELS